VGRAARPELWPRTAACCVKATGGSALVLLCLSPAHARPQALLVGRGHSTRHLVLLTTGVGAGEVPLLLCGSEVPSQRCCQQRCHLVRTQSAVLQLPIDHLVRVPTQARQCAAVYYDFRLLPLSTLRSIASGALILPGMGPRLGIAEGRSFSGSSSVWEAAPSSSGSGPGASAKRSSSTRAVGPAPPSLSEAQQAELASLVMSSFKRDATTSASILSRALDEAGRKELAAALNHGRNEAPPLSRCAAGCRRAPAGAHMCLCGTSPC
jgi:hypothetical protein